MRLARCYGGGNGLARQDACFVCGKPEPAYMSTDYEPEQVPSVPVCSLQCEDKYLASMGFCAVGSRGRSVIDTMKAADS